MCIYIFMSWIILGGRLCKLNRVYCHNNLMKHLLLPLWVRKLRPRGSVPCLWSLKYKLQSQVPSPGFLTRVAQWFWNRMQIGAQIFCLNISFSQRHVASSSSREFKMMVSKRWQFVQISGSPLGVVLTPRDIVQSLETFLVVVTIERVHLHLLDRGQECC